MGEPTLSDLDRCQHGRHLKDRCLDCPDGQSTGNLYLHRGQRIGTTVHGNAIRVAEPNRPVMPEAVRNIAGTVYPDGSVGMAISLGIPDHGVLKAWDGRETGEVQVVDSDRILAQMVIESGHFEAWLASLQKWWQDEKRKRPWL